MYPQHGVQEGKEHQQLGVISKGFRCSKECKAVALKGVPRVNLTEPRRHFCLSQRVKDIYEWGAVQHPSRQRGWIQSIQHCQSWEALVPENLQ